MKAVKIKRHDKDRTTTYFIKKGHFENNYSQLCQYSTAKIRTFMEKTRYVVTLHKVLESTVEKEMKCFQKYDVLLLESLPRKKTFK